MNGRAWFAITVVTVALGCGDGGGDTGDGQSSGIDGQWLMVSDDVKCLTALTFDNDLKYEVDDLCELDDGTMAQQVEIGTYKLNGDKISFTPTGSTCKDADRNVDDAKYDFIDGKLRMLFDEGVILLERLKSDGNASPGEVTFGCFDDEGAFTPTPLIRY